MDTSLSFLSVKPVLPGAADSTGSALGTVPPAAGGEFSTLLTGQMLKAERQLFAAQTLPGTGLQVLPLGSKIKLITSDGPLPDMASLAAFARTQGIDESAVQVLFAGQNDSSLLTSAGLGASTSLNVAPSGTLAPLQVGLRGNGQNKDLATMMAADLLTTPGLGANASVSVAPPGTLSPMLASSTIAGWMPLKATALVDASDATNPVDVSSETAIKDAMRLTITSPSQAITQRLTQMSGSSEQSTWAALLAGNRPTTSTALETKAWESLQLDVPDDLLAGYFDGPQDLTVDNSLASNTNQSAGNASASTSAGRSDPAASAQPNPSSQTEQRVIQQQQLADKLGQALAQRLVDQIERGQWKIEMRLQPESLGRIEVELKMHAGGLDALFSAENAMTRELISQGSGKLKEALTQTGMTVADVSVGGEQNRQSGGNSTPGNSSKPAFVPEGRKPGRVEDVAAAVKDGPAATDGLNVWA